MKCRQNFVMLLYLLKSIILKRRKRRLNIRTQSSVFYYGVVRRRRLQTTLLPLCDTPCTLQCTHVPSLWHTADRIDSVNRVFGSSICSGGPRRRTAAAGQDGKIQNAVKNLMPRSVWKHYVMYVMFEASCYKAPLYSKTAPGPPSSAAPVLPGPAGSAAGQVCRTVKWSQSKEYQRKNHGCHGNWIRPIA